MNNENTKFAAIEPESPPNGLEQVLLDGLPQVRSIARGIHYHLPSQVPLDDLIQAGILGLMDAFHKFNPAKHVQLKSYAKFRIRGAILDSLREMDWGPRCLRWQARRIEKARHMLHVRLGRVPGEEDIAGEMNMSLETFQRLEGELHGLGLCSLDSESLETQTGKKLDKYLPATTEMDPFSICFRSEMKFLIQTALDDFNKSECQVLTLYYLKELTMKEVGRSLGVGESRVSQIHSEALIRLREKLGKMLRIRKQSAAETHGVNSTLHTHPLKTSEIK